AHRARPGHDARRQTRPLVRRVLAARRHGSHQHPRVLRPAAPHRRPRPGAGGREGPPVTAGTAGTRSRRAETRNPVPAPSPCTPTARPLTCGFVENGVLGLQGLAGTRSKTSFLVPARVFAGQPLCTPFLQGLAGTKTPKSNACEMKTRLSRKTAGHSVARVIGGCACNEQRANPLPSPCKSLRQRQERPVPRLSVHPHPTVCHRCRALILAALDAPVAGIPVRLD